MSISFERWRPLEAALAAVGSQAEAVEDCINDEEASGRNKPLDIEFLLSDVIPSVLGLSGIPCITSINVQCSWTSAEYPFLQGRGFVFASQYAKMLPLQLAGQYLDAAIQVMEANDAGIPIKISAIKAVYKCATVHPMITNIN
jgi:hypothetical protein